MNGDKTTIIVSPVYEYEGLKNLFRIFWQYSSANGLNPDKALLQLYNEDPRFSNYKKEILDSKKYKNIYDLEVQILQEYFKGQSADWEVELVASEFCLCSVWHPDYGRRCVKNFWFIRLLILEEMNNEI